MQSMQQYTYYVLCYYVSMYSMQVCSSMYSIIMYSMHPFIRCSRYLCRYYSCMHTTSTSSLLSYTPCCMQCSRWYALSIAMDANGVTPTTAQEYHALEYAVRYVSLYYVSLYTKYHVVVHPLLALHHHIPYPLHPRLQGLMQVCRHVASTTLLSCTTVSIHCMHALCMICSIQCYGC